MKPKGPRSLWNVLIVTVLVGFATALVGCGSVGPVTPVMVSDVKSVAGTWRGMLYRSGLQPDYVTLTIRDDGSYDLVSAQPDGTSRGRGKIVINDGRLRIEGEKGHGTGMLLKNPAGDFVMNLDAVLSDNSTVSAKLWPANP
jgi:hypothetical protein